MEYQFKKTMSERSDNQLIQIVTTDREKYNSSAIEAAENEIEKRKLDQSIIKERKENLEFEKEETEKVESNLASTGKRFLNYFIDVIAGYLFAFIVAMIIALLFPIDIIGYPWTLTILLVSSFFAYYIMMEIIFQKTIGKFITKTRVVTIRGNKPTEQDIILRTFCRIIPFDHISFLFTKNGFHDYLSKTKVVKDNPGK